MLADQLDYVVGVDTTGEIVACGALKEYSPSVAEIAAIAVSRDVHGCGVGKAIVSAVETLALKRDIYDVFEHKDQQTVIAMDPGAVPDRALAAVR